MWLGASPRDQRKPLAPACILPLVIQGHEHVLLAGGEIDLYVRQQTDGDALST